jgi:hypothetical protein
MKYELIGQLHFDCKRATLGKTNDLFFVTEASYPMSSAIISGLSRECVLEGLELLGSIAIA